MSIVKKPEREFHDPPLEGEISPMRYFNLKWALFSTGVIFMITILVIGTQYPNITSFGVGLKLLLSPILGILISPLIQWCLENTGVKL